MRQEIRVVMFSKQVITMHLRWRTKPVFKKKYLEEINEESLSNVLTVFTYCNETSM